MFQIDVFVGGTKEDLAYQIGGKKMPPNEIEAENQQRSNKRKGKISTN